LKKQLDKEGELRVKIGELIFVARPVIYSFMLVKYGVHSFKPYLWSLGLDLLRYLDVWILEYGWKGRSNTIMNGKNKK